MTRVPLSHLKFALQQVLLLALRLQGLGRCHKTLAQVAQLQSTPRILLLEARDLPEQVLALGL